MNVLKLLRSDPGGMFAKRSVQDEAGSGRNAPMLMVDHITEFFKK